MSDRHTEELNHATDLIRNGITHLSEHERPYYERILERLRESKTPASASASSHGGFEDGLLIHTSRVYWLALGMAQGFYLNNDRFHSSVEPYLQKPASELIEEARSLNHGNSVFKAAFLHDLNKMATLRGEPYYLPNMIKKGTVRSTDKPWMTNPNKGAVATLAAEAGQLRDGNNRSWLDAFNSDEGVSVRDGLISLAIAEKYSPGILGTLSVDERQAIIYHDGAYAGRSGLTGKESMLQIIIHAADMLASRFYC